SRLQAQQLRVQRVVAVAARTRGLARSVERCLERRAIRGNTRAFLGQLLSGAFRIREPRPRFVEPRGFVCDLLFDVAALALQTLAARVGRLDLHAANT